MFIERRNKVGARSVRSAIFRPSRGLIPKFNPKSIDIASLWDAKYSLLRTLNTGGCAVLLHQIHCFVCQLEQMRMRAIAICHNREPELAIAIA